MNSPGYIKIETLEYPLYEGDIRLAHPGMGDEFVCPNDFCPVQWVDEPACDPYHFCVAGQPELIDGQWEMTWVIKEVSPEARYILDNPKPTVADNSEPPDVTT